MTSPSGPEEAHDVVAMLAEVDEQVAKSTPPGATAEQSENLGEYTHHLFGA